MDYITILGLTKDRAEIMDLLQRRGVVEISETDPYAQSDTDNPADSNDAGEDAPAETEEDVFYRKLRTEDVEISGKQERRLADTIQRLDHVIDVLDRKFPDITVDREILELNEDDFWQMKDKTTGIVIRLQNLEDLLEEEAHLKAEIDQWRHKSEMLEPWRNVDIDLYRPATDHTAIFLGTAEDTDPLEDMLEEIRDFAPEVALIPLADEIPDVSDHLIAVVALKEHERQVFSYLKSSVISLLPRDDFRGTADTEFTKLQAKITSAKKRLEDINGALEAEAHERADFMVLSDYYRVLRRRFEEQQKTETTKYTFVLNGFIPQKNTAEVKQELEEKFAVAVDAVDAGDSENVPIKLENPPFARDYEVIVEMFGAPNMREVDPTPILAPFDFFFFGMMLSDVGYGFLLTALCAFLVYVKKVRGEMLKMSRMLMISGVASMAWGFVFGGFFGNMVDTLSQGTKTFPALWFNPMDDPMKLIIWSILFGVIHLYFGMGIKMVNEFKYGHWTNAVFDVFPWYLIITGLGLMIAGIGGKVGMILALVGAGIILLFAGRGIKNPLKRLIKGLTGLYDITSYFGDILSYSRILALVLATSVIAIVVNMLGFLQGPTVLGYILFIIIGTFGHVLNLALSALSAYVHSSRLQYVEFFGKFFEGGGRYFKPLDVKTDYVRLERKE